MAKKPSIELTPQDQRERKMYEHQAETPRLWQMWAREYLYSGNRLMDLFYRLHLQWDDSTRETTQMDWELTSTGPIMLLYGVAIENLIKGIMVAQGKVEIVQDGKLSSSIGHHSLTDLCRLAGLKQSDVDRRLLIRLQRAIENKYPVSKKPTSPDEYSGSWKENSDFQHILMVFNTLETKLHKLRPAETDAPLDVTVVGWGLGGCPFARQRGQ